MTHNHAKYIDKWLGHIHALAVDIGPRGSTTEGERRGSEYCRSVLAALGLDAQVEPFTSARSIYGPQILTSALIVIAFAMYPLAGQTSAIIAAAITVVTMICQILELGFKDNPYRWMLAKGSSQNVVARLPPKGEHRQDLILIGHVDTQRSAFIFSSFAWVDFFRVFATTAFFSFCIEAVLYVVGAITGAGWVWPVTAFSALCGLILGAICVQAEFTPFTPGANDNATAAGLVLTLARHFQQAPLRHTRVWLACTGCEEVKHYGAIDFFRRHQSEMVNPHALVFEMLGCDGPAWLTREGIVPPFLYHADPAMVTLAEEIASEFPRFNAHPTAVGVGHTEMADALRLGIPAITFIGIAKDGGKFGYRGKQLYWHQMADTFDKMESEVLARAYDFTWEFIRALDAQAADHR